MEYLGAGFRDSRPVTIFHSISPVPLANEPNMGAPYFVP